MFTLERGGLRRGNSKRRVARALLALLLVGPILPALAAEPDGPSTLINRADVIRIIILNDLSGKFAGETEAKKSARGALVEYYSDAPRLAPSCRKCARLRLIAGGANEGGSHDGRGSTTYHD